MPRRKVEPRQDQETEPAQPVEDPEEPRAETPQAESEETAESTQQNTEESPQTAADAGPGDMVKVKYLGLASVIRIAGYKFRPGEILEIKRSQVDEFLTVPFERFEVVKETRDGDS